MNPVVLQVLPSLDTGGGGAEQTAFDVAEALTKEQTPAFVTSSGGRLAEAIQQFGAIHITLPLASKNPFIIFLNVFRLKKIIKKYNINIIHARSRAPAWSSKMAAQLTGCKFLTTFHGTYSYGPGVLGKLKKYYNSVMTDGDLVIANSNFIAEHLITRYNLSKNKIRVIPRGVDLDKFTSENVSSTRDVELKGLWKLNKDSIIVTLPGRLSRWKGQSLLIEAFSILKDRDDKNNNNLVCLLLGSDQGRSSYRMELEKLIESKNLKDVIKIHGHCDDMAAAYSITDIVISASTRPEAFGRVVSEAQAMGCHIVAADHGGGAEQIINGKTGWLFKPNDAEALATSISNILSMTESDRFEISQKAITHVRMKYTKKEMCSATLKVYSELIS